MIKNKLFSVFMIFLCSSQILNAEDFRYLLNKAIESNSNLKSSEIEIDLVKEKGSILTRFNNPTIDLNYSNYKFKEQINKDNGYGVSLTQKIVPWNVANDKTRLSETTIKNEVDKYNLDKQEFIKELSIKYTIYAKNKKFFNVIKESEDIANKVYDISNQQYKVGAISKAELLQSEIELMDIKKKKDELNLEIMNTYYDLIRFSGIDQEIHFNLESDYKFKITKSINLEKNPFINSEESKKDMLLAEAKLDSNTSNSFLALNNLLRSFSNLNADFLIKLSIPTNLESDNICATKLYFLLAESYFFSRPCNLSTLKSSIDLFKK